MQGYLYKYANMFSGYRKRYFRLQGDVLLYYKDKGGKLKDTFYLKQTEIQTTQKQPLKIHLRAGAKKMQLKAGSIQQKVMWYNALSNSKQASSTKSFALGKNQDQKNGQDFNHNYQTPLKENQNSNQRAQSPIPYFREETVLDQKLNKIWTHQASLDQEVRSLQIQSAESGSNQYQTHVEKISSISAELKKAVTEAAIEIESNKNELVRILRDLRKKQESLNAAATNSKNLKDRQQSGANNHQAARASFISVKSHQNGDQQVQDNQQQSNTNLSISKVSGPRAISNLAPEAAQGGDDDAVNSIMTEQQQNHSFQSFEDQIFYDAQQSFKQVPQILQKPNKKSVKVPQVTQNQDEQEQKKVASNIGLNQEQEDKHKHGDGDNDDEDDDDDDDDQEDEKFPQFRKQLPVMRDPKKKFSIWSIIKDAIGKDLTKFTVPVFFNEPLSMVQKITQALQYEQLLVRASKEQNSLLRLAYLSVFNVVQYTCSDQRLLKPFNPLLGETFQYVDPNGQFRYFSEQVSHHPPISACHAESKHYEFYMNTAMKSSFGMKTIEFRPLGSCYVNLKLQFNDSTELYHANRPNSCVHNIIMGKMWMDHVGTVTVTNRSTREKSVVKFHKAGWSKKTLNTISATIYDHRGIESISLQGKWSESISMTILQTGQVREIWRRNQRIDKWEEQYHFTEFTLQLNHLTPKLMKAIAPTDSRFRLDQRALELGNLKDAAFQKTRLEVKQRKARAAREKRKQKWSANYFEQMVDQQTKQKYYKFNGKYWDDRKNKNWTHLPDLFSEDKDESPQK